jgi:hypothetical protein
MQFIKNQTSLRAGKFASSDKDLTGKQTAVPGVVVQNILHVRTDCDGFRVLGFKGIPGAEVPFPIEGEWDGRIGTLLP